MTVPTSPEPSTLRPGRNRLVVRVGEFDLNYDTDAAHQDLLVDRIIVHPEYVHRRKHHDIALLHLNRRVRLGGHVRPVCLPPRGADLTGSKASVAGWGHTEFGEWADRAGEGV